MQQVSAAPQNRPTILADQLALDLLDVRRAADIAHFEVHISSLILCFYYGYAAACYPLIAATLSAADVVTSLSGVMVQAVDCALIGYGNVPMLAADSDQRPAGSGRQRSRSVEH